MSYPSVTIRRDGDLPKAMDVMSLDGAFRLAFAFGLLEHPNQQIDLRRYWERSEIELILSRGLQRLGMYEEERDFNLSARLFVHLPAVEALDRNPATEEDRLLATQVLSIWRSSHFMKRDMRGRFVRGQLSLF